jgi:peroxiredoxin
MKDLYKFILLPFFASLALLFCTSNTTGQQVIYSQKDSTAIKNTALDYIDGYYSGNTERVEKAIHPDLNKATPRDLPQTGRTTMNYTTWSGLIEFTRAKAGYIDDTARHIKVVILNIENEVSNVKAVSSQYIDYLQIARLDGEWKIINVLFASGPKNPPRLKNFAPDMEKPAVEKAAMTYLNGLSAADAGKLEMVLDPEFNKVTLQPVAQSGKTALRRQRYESVVETTRAGIGKQDEVYRNNKVKVLDMQDGIAVVRCEATGLIEQVQLYKGDGQWKLFNCISRPNTSLTLQQAMTVIAGDPMPEFSLPVYDGGTFNLSDYQGKNVILIFPRGWTGNNWCSYCPYQYLELEKLEKEQHIMKKYNVQVAYVMPYSSDRIKDWMEKFPDGLEVIEGIKNPANPPQAGSIQAEYADWVRKNFPLVFKVDKGDTHDVIPVLVDEDRSLSRLLKLFTNFWDGVSAEQNIASVFIIDKKGVLRYKYIGQMTEDRPAVDFLLNIIDDLND